MIQMINFRLFERNSRRNVINIVIYELVYHIISGSIHRTLPIGCTGVPSLVHEML